MREFLRGFSVMRSNSGSEDSLLIAFKLFDKDGDSTLDKVGEALLLMSTSQC